MGPQELLPPDSLQAQEAANGHAPRSASSVADTPRATRVFGGPRPLLIAMAGVIAALAILSLYLFSRLAPVAAQNGKLSAELRALETRVAEAESQSKSLSERLAGAEKERKNLKDALDQLKRQNESIAFDLQKAEAKASGADEEKVYLEEMLINKTKEIERLRAGVPDGAVPAAAQAPADLRQKDEEIRRLQEQNRILSTRIENLYKLTNEKISEINVAKITLEETIAAARRKIEQEWTTVDLGSIDLTAGKGEGVKGEAPRKVAKKEGRVLALNPDHGFVVVDLGRADGLRSDATFEVRRGKDPIATLTILEMRDVMSACNIQELQPGKKIEVNDQVLIRK